MSKNQGASPVRVVNKSPDMPHIIKYNSLWYIVNPANGTQFQKMTYPIETKKEIKDRDGRLVRTAVKKTRATTLAQVFIVKTAEGKDEEVFVPFEKDGASWVLAKPPRGAKAKIDEFKNYVDMPPDAANKTFHAGFQGVNPETQGKDWEYHNGDLVRLEDDHEEVVKLMSARKKSITDLEEQHIALDKSLADKMAELKKLDADAAAKRALASTPAPKPGQ